MEFEILELEDYWFRMAEDDFGGKWVDGFSIERIHLCLAAVGFPIDTLNDFWPVHIEHVVLVDCLCKVLLIVFLLEIVLQLKSQLWVLPVRAKL